MKKQIAMFLVWMMSFAVMACGGDKQTKTELIVFAASSMTETLTEIGELYQKENPEVTLIFNFDSSGTLKTQIEEGAACDVFISAGQKQMDQLGDIEADTRINLLENKVALCVAEGSDKNIKTFQDLAQALKEGNMLLAMGNADVPVGQYTQKILAYYHLDEEELAKSGVISYGSNVKEVTTQISEGSVDCGVIYGTDAFSAGLTVQDYAAKEMCGQIIYPAAVLEDSKQKEAAKKFLAFLQTEECLKVFEKVGFSRVN